MASKSNLKKPHDPLVYAVILTWNDTEMTLRCLKSVLANDYANLEIIVVDNGSKEPCGKTIQQSFPDIELVVLPENRGFTGGGNAGLARAMELHADYIFFLNNDTIVDPNAVRHLVDAITSRPACAAASALLLFPDKQKRVQFYTATVDRDCAMHYHHEENTLLSSREWPVAETEFAPACAILFRSKTLEKTGLFDESLGTNWEDYDLCLRIQDAGWKIIAVGNAVVEHHHGATTGRVSPYITYYFTRNRLICFRRYARIGKILRRTPYIARTFYWQIKAYGFSNWACHRAFLKAIWDFLLGTRGEQRRARRLADRR